MVVKCNLNRTYQSLRHNFSEMSKLEETGSRVGNLPSRAVPDGLTGGPPSVAGEPQSSALGSGGRRTHKRNGRKVSWHWDSDFFEDGGTC